PPALHTLSLHDALPILNPEAATRRFAADSSQWQQVAMREQLSVRPDYAARGWRPGDELDLQSAGEVSIGRFTTKADGVDHHSLRDRKSTRLNSSHSQIS